MENPQTFFWQLTHHTTARTGLAIATLALVLGILTHIGAMDTVGPPRVMYALAGFMLAVVLFAVFSHTEMRAKRGLAPFWPWQRK